jgi:hypothetical protein
VHFPSNEQGLGEQGESSSAATWTVKAPVKAIKVTTSSGNIFIALNECEAPVVNDSSLAVVMGGWWHHLRCKWVVGEVLIFRKHPLFVEMGGQIQLATTLGTFGSSI